MLHDSTLNQRPDMDFKEELGRTITAAVQRCIDDGLARPDDASTVVLDPRAAEHGAVSMRVNQPDQHWPPLEGQVDRFLRKLVGASPAPAPENNWRRGCRSRTVPSASVGGIRLHRAGWRGGRARTSSVHGWGRAGCCTRRRRPSAGVGNSPARRPFRRGGCRDCPATSGRPGLEGDRRLRNDCS
ncbi:hypothetical protein ACFV2X_07935 [Streptomyces sp. NPDC059679]|uniref:hypothetical protein n=1 Tax=Streptomyces sp. NPDC059679 TaxID=3346903 RepID=UPI0036BC9072